MFLQFGVDVVAVVVAAFLSMAIGMLWYSPPLWGKRWRALASLPPGPAKKAVPAYVTASAASLLTSYVMAVFINLSNATTLVQGSFIGFLFWLGFAGPILAMTHAFEHRPAALFFINAGYPLVAFAVMGAVLAAL